MATVLVETELHPDYPLPDVDDPVMRPFWDGTRELRFMQQRDRVTGEVCWPPKPVYWKGGQRLEWFEASGKGTVFTYVVGHEPFLPAFKHLLPHIMVVVQLAEGGRLVGHMVGCRPEEMSIGARVRVAFKRLTDRVVLPVWELDRQNGTPGLVVHLGARPYTVVAFDVAGDRIAAVRTVVNPEKLRHLPSLQ